MSSYTPQFFGADAVVAQVEVDAARTQVISAGQAVKYATTPELKAAAEQARIQANDNLIIAQNNLRMAKNPQAQSIVIDSSTRTTVSDIQKFYSQQPASTPAPASLQEAIIIKQAAQPSAGVSTPNLSWILKQAAAYKDAYKKQAAQPQVNMSSQPSTVKSQIPWPLIAGVSFLALKTFVLKH